MATAPTGELTSPRARRHPERRAARAALAVRRHATCCCASTTARPAASWCGGCTGSSTRAADRRSGARRLGHRRLHLPRPGGARRAAGVARQLRAGVPAGHGGARGRARRRRREQPRSTGRQPLGTADVHVALAVLSPDAARLEAVAERARARPRGARRRRGDLAAGLLPAADRAHVVRLQGRDRPAGGRGQRPCRRPTRRSAPLKAGEIVLGYPDETGELPPMPTPGGARPQRHLRRLPQAAHPGRGLPAVPAREGARAARRRRCSGAKMVGRWQSGAPLALSPERDDPELGADPQRNNDFLYGDDPRGFKCPAGAHARRANPRDALDDDGSVDVRLHRMIRRGTSYGPMLPEGVLEDDGADRGIVFVFAGAHLKRQFEFVKTQWLNDGIFIGAPAEKDPLVGPNDGTGDLHHPAAADPPPAAGPAAVRRHPRRRVLLRSRPARAALAGGARHVTARADEGGRQWPRARQAPTAGRRSTSARRRPTSAEPDAAGARRLRRRRARRRDHAQPAARRQRDHHRDGRAADRDPRDDRGPPGRPRRHPHRRRRRGRSRSAATCASART